MEKNSWSAIPYIPLTAAIAGFGGIVIVTAPQGNLHERHLISALCALTPTVASMAVILSLLLVFSLFYAQERINEFHRGLSQLRSCSIAEASDECFQYAINSLAPYEQSHGQSYLSIARVSRFVLHLIIGFNCLFAVLCAYHGPWPTVFYPLFTYLALAITGITWLWLLSTHLEQSAQIMTQQIAPLTPENAAAEGWNPHVDGGRLLASSGFSFQVVKGELRFHTHLRNFWHCLYITRHDLSAEYPCFIALTPCSQKMSRPLYLQLDPKCHSLGFTHHLPFPTEALLPALQHSTHPDAATFKCSFLLSPESAQRIYSIELLPRIIENDNLYLERNRKNHESIPHPLWLGLLLEMLPSPECRIAMWSHHPAGIDPEGFLKGVRHNLERSALLLPDRAGLYAVWQKK